MNWGQAWDGLGSIWMAIQAEASGANARHFGNSRASSQRILSRECKQCMVSSEPCAWLKLRMEELLAHLRLLLRPPNLSLGSSQRWYPHISAPPVVENMTWETSASLHGSKMALVYASLVLPRASPRQSFFLPDFYKHEAWCQGSQSESQRYLDRFDVWFICYHEGLCTGGRTSLKRRRKEQEAESTLEVWEEPGKWWSS